MLADKVVTLAELEQAAHVFVDCVTEAGGTVAQDVGPDTGYVGPSSYSVEYPVTSAQAGDAIEHKIDACRGEVNAIEDVWVLQHETSEAEKEKAEQAFPGCARKAGMSLADDVDWADATRTAAAALEKSNFLGSSHWTASPKPTQAASPIVDGVDMIALDQCLDDLTTKTSGALPGLADALATLNPSAP